MLIDGKSVNSFAQSCGVSEGSIRQYLNGTIPRMDKVVQIAKAAQVRLEWLATGEGPMRVDMQANPLPSPLDCDLLARIMQEAAQIFSPEMELAERQEFSRVVIEIYKSITELKVFSEAEKNAVLRYAVEQLRRQRT